MSFSSSSKSLLSRALASPTWLKLAVGAAAVLIYAGFFMPAPPAREDAGERDPYANQPARGMFGGGGGSGGRKRGDPPVPPHLWPKTRDGRRIFQATDEWQEVPEDCVLPPGLHVQMEMGTNRRMAKWPSD